MESVTCPACGCELPISIFMPASVRCKKCKATFEVEYDPAELNFWGKAKVKYNNFSIKHPHIIKGLKVVVIGAAVSVAGYCIGKHAIENSTSSTNESLPASEDPSTDCDLLGNDYDDDVECDDAGYDDHPLDGYCRTCGAPLYEGFYTAPWEDDDNEYGYWTCRRCHAINIDWSTSDDD